MRAPSSAASMARLAKAFGRWFLAMTRTGHTDSPHADEARPSRLVADILPVAHAVVVTLSLTDDARGMIDAAAR